VKDLNVLHIYVQHKQGETNMIYNIEYAAEVLTQYLASEGLEISPEKKTIILSSEGAVNLLGKWSNAKQQVERRKNLIAKHMASFVNKYNEHSNQARYSHGLKAQVSIAHLADLHNTLNEWQEEIKETAFNLYYICQ
jgi:multidrug resistance efflux pump